MSRRLLVLNVALGIVAVVLAAGIVRTLVAKRPVPPPQAQKAVSAPAPAPATPAGDAGSGGYTVIAARNLFSPGRSETTEVAAATPVAKPILHGVVIDGTKSRAFLEDPTFKRVAGYSVGDSVGGGKIQRIADDRVVIARPEGLLEVLLQDPSKPRPAPTAPTPTAAQGEPAQAGSPQAGSPQAGSAQVAPRPSPGPPALPPVRQRVPPQRRPSDD